MNLINYFVLILLIMTCTSLQCVEHLKSEEIKSISNYIKASESDFECSKTDLQSIQNEDCLTSDFWNGVVDLCKAYTNIAILKLTFTHVLKQSSWHGSHFPS